MKAVKLTSIGHSTCLQTLLSLCLDFGIKAKKWSYATSKATEKKKREMTKSRERERESIAINAAGMG